MQRPTKCAENRGAGRLEYAVDYGDPVAWLFSLHKFGMKLGLENIRILLEDRGRPQDAFRSVLIAGTNGKGSTAAMLHAILLAAGRRSGLYTSPHLVNTEERIRIGDRDIDAAELAAILSDIRTAIDRMLAAGTLAATPTFFEVITAAALVAFARAGIEIAVLEVGLGGRLDATNVVDPVLSIITTIDKDHQEQLGGTLDAIAREKAGILRSQVRAILGPLAPEPLAAIRAPATAEGGCPPLEGAAERSDTSAQPRTKQRQTQARSSRRRRRFSHPRWRGTTPLHTRW